MKRTQSPDAVGQEGTAKRADELHAYLLDRFGDSIEPRELRRRGGARLEQWVAAAAEFVARRDAADLGVRVWNAAFGGAERTVIEVLAPDRPFLVDTFHLTMRRLGLREKLFAHPLLDIERDDDGVVAALGSQARDGSREAYLYAEVALIPEESARDAIRDELVRVYRDLDAIVDDHAHMVHALREHTAAIELGSRGGDPERARERMDFLSWLADDNYVFFGYRRYDVQRIDDGWRVELTPGQNAGLGLLRENDTSRFREPLSNGDIPEITRARLDDPRLVFFDKSRSTSTIHREGRLDCVTIKRLDERGETVGFGRFVGLLTYKAIQTRASSVPILRSRRDRVLDAIGAEPGSHTHKAAIASFDSLPLEFLFPFDLADITRAVERILKAAETRGFEVAAVADPRNRSFFLSAMIPRSRYDESLRESLHALLVNEYAVIYVDHRSSFIDEKLALIHFFCACSEDVPADTLERLQNDVRERVRGWEDRFESALLDAHTEATGQALAGSYAAAFCDEYRMGTTPAEAVRDVERLERLRRGESSVELALLDDAGGSARLKVYVSERPYLTDLLPTIDEFGLCVVDATTTEVATRDGGTYWIVSFRVDALDCDGPSKLRALEGLGRALHGEVESSPLHRLILGAGLDWREVDLLRAYAFYAHQIRCAPQHSYLSDTLSRHPAATRALVDLFRARFDPDLPRDRQRAESLALEMLSAARDPIPTSQEDRVFALLQNLVESTERTAFFRETDPGEHSIVLKFASGRIRNMPSPRPRTEIWVHSSRMSGIHLRGGRIARGGLRWSERPQDLRTEVLGLMKTQMVKNGLIVPLGSKGGFVLKTLQDGAAARRAEADRQYANFVRCLLSVTDDTRDGQVIPPARVVRHDGDDPYLVVAADKGTAHLSDVANAVAAETGFWLGDAFASGGSEGYDHKAEGITARGAWACVNRHFLELGLDAERETFSVAGIGDMSGDVFGNGMLLARTARLLAAFDHRHVFLDPEPDPETSWRERRRLFALASSSWLDYDPSLISPGGGVFERDAREVPLSAEVRELLGVEDERLSGDELVRAILKLPVDLLWNGGIGTYVRASFESDEDAGDRANDGVRIEARELRARVVGEGGNLGLTQLARVEYALGGGRANTDAIDNSAGVDLSDHEVNFKILLAPALSAGRMTREERNRYLRDCVESANSAVLSHNLAQSRCLSMDELRASEDPARIASAVDYLARHGGLDPAVEYLPDDDQRRGHPPHRAWVRPELAVLLGYTKRLAKQALAASARVDAPAFHAVLESYFPRRLREALPEEIDAHPLRREITATCLTNRVIDRAGVTLIPELATALGASVPDIVCTCYALDELLDADRLRVAIDAAAVPETARLTARLRIEACVRSVTRDWLGLEEGLPDLAHWGVALAGVRPRLGAMTEGRAPGGDVRDPDPDSQELEALGFAPELAADIANLPRVAGTLTVLPVVERTGAPLLEAIELWTRVGEELQVRFVLEGLADLDPGDDWDRVAAESLHLDVVGAQRQLCAELLATGDAMQALAAFRGARAAALADLRASADRVQADPRAGLSALAALCRQIRLLS
ncbi:MAG: NAD-glutamate dehydrogenase [Deltaproteobacteria bacterium]|nr:NAD-glutamate dehydrogenase [Deltaproteobacteria bacterium]